MHTRFDVIWIGTGQATLSTVLKLLGAGRTVAVIERSFFGGTCVNNGCTPTKALVATARTIHQVQRGNDFGFKISGMEVDFPRVMKMQQDERKIATEFIEHRLADEKGCDIFKGEAFFTGKHSVSVGGIELSAEHIVINAGTRPRAPVVAGIDTIQALNNESLLDLVERPQHLAIIGGSYIGLEFAQIFRRLGSDVTVFVRGSQLMPREDQDVASIAHEVLSHEGVNFVYNSELSEVEGEQKGNSVLLSYSVNKTQHISKASHVLFAIGRAPNADLLNTEQAGIELDPRGYIPVNEAGQTTQPHIYALGDINGKGAFTHTSVNDGEVFWDHYSAQLELADEEWPARQIDGRAMIYAMFIDPPLARIGLSEKEASKSDANLMIATMPMANIARAREKQETAGIVKLIVDADSELIVGATIFGTGGDEVVGAIASFMQTKQSYKLFRRTVFPHPTVTELLPWVLDDLRPVSRCRYPDDCRVGSKYEV